MPDGRVRSATPRAAEFKRRFVSLEPLPFLAMDEGPEQIRHNGDVLRNLTICRRTRVSLLIAACSSLLGKESRIANHR